MSPEPPTTDPDEPGRAGSEERDAFGNPIQPGAGQSRPAPPPTPPPGYGPPPAPPAGQPPTAPPAAPPGTAAQPPTLPPSAPPGAVAQPAWPPGTFAGHTLASWGSRAVAWLVDLLLLVAPWVLVVLALVAERNALGAILIVLAIIWAYFIYAPVFMMRAGEHNGQTPGKQIAGIRVVRESAEPLTFGYSLLREFAVKQLLIGVVGGFFLLPVLLDYLWPLWDDQNRALHDMVAQTRVVEA